MFAIEELVKVRLWSDDCPLVDAIVVGEGKYPVEDLEIGYYILVIEHGTHGITRTFANEWDVFKHA